MNRLFFIFCAIFVLNLSSCKFFVNYFETESDDGRIKSSIRDIVVVPDKYNTGPVSGTEFKKHTEDGFVAENVYVIVRNDASNDYQISWYKGGGVELPDYAVVKNYDFSDRNFSFNGINKFAKSKKIRFENCKFKGFRNDAAVPGESRLYCEFDHCSFSGGVNSSYITLINCKIGGFTSDGMNPLREFYAENLYVYDLLHEKNDAGTHIDGVQIYGDQRSRNTVVNDKWISKVETGEIHFKNVRFEIPSINFGGAKTYVNACIMFQLEFSDVDNVSFEDIWINGGGKWYPIYVDNGKNNERSIRGAWSHKNVSIKNAMVSNTYGKIFCPNIIEDGIFEQVKHHDKMYVSSVFKDDSGTVHIICSNDTKTDKEFFVKTDKGTWKFFIPHCPSNWAIEEGKPSPYVEPEETLIDLNNKSYTDYRWDDFPFDVDFKISGNPSFVLCTCDGEEIRYVKFDKKAHYYTEIKSEILNNP